MTRLILDLFAGPGGWSEGLAQLGLSEIGLEWDTAACRTAVAAGHRRVQADVAAYPTEPFVGKVSGLIASPPCQDFSLAGKRAGLAGDRGQLVWQVVRWADALRPEWIALEQVPPVLEIWQHVAHTFRGWGYSSWAGVLNAADYGVPQTRRRAFLIASRVRDAQPPEPTHCPGGRDAGLFGGGLLPWTSMAEALGWGQSFLQRERSGARAEKASTPEPSQTLTSKARSWVVHTGANSMKHSRVGSRRGEGGVVAYERSINEPAPTLDAKVGSAWKIGPGPDWIFDRPATTVVGSFCPDVIAAPGYRTSTSRQNAEASVRVTVAEASVLQSFRPDYPWQGSRTKQFEQVGNAVPPLLAAHVISAASGVPFQQSERAA